MPEISVIVPARNAAATIRPALEAILAQDFDREFEVVVVDDGSTDGTREIVSRFAPRVRLVAQAQAGPGPARDRGVGEAGGSMLAFTDADCVPTPGWLRRGVAALAEADFVQGAVRPDPAAMRAPFDRTVWVDGRGGLYETANLFVRRDLFERLGGFEDWLRARLGKPLAEDVWFGWRARRSGARMAFSDEALVHHAVFPRRARDYVAERARLVYFPAIVARIPELRRELLVGRVFLSRRSLAFDGALAGGVVAVVAGAPLALLAAVPYTWLAARDARRWGRRAPEALAGGVAADAVGFGALVAGSLRRGSPVV